MLRILCNHAAKQMRINCVKEWQAVHAKDRALQTSKDCQRTLVAYFHVPVQLLKHVECVGLEQRDCRTCSALKNNRTLARNIVTLHAVDESANVSILLFERHLAALDQWITQLLHNVC